MTPVKCFCHANAPANVHDKSHRRRKKDHRCEQRCPQVAAIEEQRARNVIQAARWVQPVIVGAAGRANRPEISHKGKVSLANIADSSATT